MSAEGRRRDCDLLALYFSDIRRHRLLNRADEQRLGRMIDAGREAGAALQAGVPSDTLDRRRLEALVDEAEQARLEFVQANLRLVVSVARGYQSSQVPLLDMIQDGNLGLLHAVDRFDWRRGFKFSTYAVWWIRQAIGRGISDTSRTVHLSLDTVKRIRGVVAARDRLRAQLGRVPTVIEIAADQRIRADQVVEALVLSETPRSLSQALEIGGEAILGDVIADPAPDPADQAATAVLPREVRGLLAALHEREHRVLSLRFGLDQGHPRTLEEVGRHLQLTRERIRQIEARALCKLRHPSAPADARELLQGTEGHGLTPR